MQSTARGLVRDIRGILSGPLSRVVARREARLELTGDQIPPRPVTFHGSGRERLVQDPHLGRVVAVRLEQHRDDAVPLWIGPVRIPPREDEPPRSFDREELAGDYRA